MMHFYNGLTVSDYETLTWRRKEAFVDYMHEYQVAVERARSGSS